MNDGHVNILSRTAADSTSILSTLLGYPQSTIALFERFGCLLRPSQVRQRRIHENDREILVRDVLLVHPVTRRVVIAAQSKLSLDALCPFQLDAIIRGVEPLGKIFDPDGRGRMRKSNYVIRQQVDHGLTALLALSEPKECFAQQYDVEVDRVPVGSIIEQFNHESIARAFDRE